MARTFNVTGSCDPQLHYMVDLTERLGKIKALIDRGDYFTINRARQYGKTTTIKALRNYLREDYIVISLDFQRIGNCWMNGSPEARRFPMYPRHGRRRASMPLSTC